MTEPRTPYEIPQGWQVMPLRDLVRKMKAGGTPSRTEPSYWGGDIPFVLIEDMTSCGMFLEKTKETITRAGLDNSSCWIVPEGSVLVSMYATIGVTAINTMPVATNQAIMALETSPSLHPQFVAHQIRLRADDLVRLNVQSTQKNINKGILEQFPIWVPPLPEQKAIAGALRAVQRAKEATGKVIAATKELKRSLMKHLFTYGPVPVEEAASVPLKETEIGMIPEHWNVTRLGDIARIGNGSTPARTNSSYWHGGTEPWLTSGKIHESIIDRADEFVTEVACEECHLPLVPKESLLVAITGQGKTLGNAALVKFDTRISQHLAYVSVHDSSVSPLFLLLFLQTQYRRFRAVSSGGGSTKGALTCGFLKSFPTPLPPRHEQDVIAQILAVTSCAMRANEGTALSMRAIFDTSCGRLMTGKTRIDPQHFEEIASAVAG